MKNYRAKFFISLFVGILSISIGFLTNEQTSYAEKNNQTIDQLNAKQIIDIFPNKILAQSVAQALGTEINTCVTQQQLDTITTLTLSGEYDYYQSLKRNLNLFKGFEHLPNIEELSLNYLYELNQQSLLPISGATKLTKLSLNSCRAYRHTKLRTLSQILPYDLPNLKKLSLDIDGPSDALDNLFRLEKYEHLEELEISNLSPYLKFPSLNEFFGLHNLKKLSLQNLGLSNIDNFSFLTNLEYINLKGNNISDFSILNQLPNLKQIIK